MSYLLGIDLGTSVLKSVLIDEAGEKQLIYSKSYRFAVPKKGFVEQDPEVWWAACKETVSAITGSIRTEQAVIRAVSFSGQMHGLVMLDRNHQVIRPAILHNDSRSLSQVNEIKQILGLEKIKTLIGNPIYTGFMLPSLLWVREHERENYEKIRYVMLPKDYLKFRMTGEITTDYSDASGTLLFDIINRCWSTEIIDRMQLDRRIFPACYETVQRVGAVTRKAAEETGIPAGTVVTAGGGDQVMQSIGNGVIHPGAACVNVGTSGQVSYQCDHPVINPALNTNTFCGYEAGRWYTMGAIMSAGMAYRWFHSLFESDDYEGTNSKIAALKPGSGGLIFLPYLNGERTPHLNPNISGGLIGVSINTTRYEMARAVMEGVTYALHECLELCGELGLKQGILTASGGAARSRIWLQIQADVFNLPLRVSRTKEQAGLGAAIAAGVGAGIYKNIAEGCSKQVSFEEELIEPNPEHHKIYREYYALYKELFQKSFKVIEKITLLGRKG